MHHTPPPAPLIIQGAHFEFHEPQILPTSETFIANPKERKQPEFYKFWVLKDLPPYSGITVAPVIVPNNARYHWEVLGFDNLLFSLFLF